MRRGLAVGVLVLGLWQGYVWGQTGDQAEKDLAFAQGLYTQQNYALAAEKFVAFAQRYPTHANLSLVLFRAGECLYHANRFAEAEPYFQRLIQQFPQSAEEPLGNVWLGDTRFQLQRYAEAAQAYEHFLREHPNHELAGHAAYWQGECYCNLGQYETAIAAYQQALPRKLTDQEAAYARYALGWAHLQLNQPDKATPYLQQVLDKYPASPVAAECQYLIGESARRRRDYAAASAAFQKVGARYPNSPFAAFAQQGLAFCQFDQKDYAAALEGFRAVTTRYPNSPAAAESRLRAADCLFHLKRYGEAAMAYEQVAGAGDQWADEALYWLGVSHEQQQKPEAARAAYEKLTSGNKPSPRRADAYLRLARLQVAAGQKEAAERSYQAAVQAASDPRTQQQARLGLAWARYQTAPSEATLNQLDAAVRQDPKLPLAFDLGYQAAVAHFTAGRFAPALELLELLTTSQPEHGRRAEALYLSGLCHDRRNEPGPAEDLYRRVLRESKDPDTAGLAAGALVGLLARQNKLEAARKVVEELSKGGAAAPTRAQAMAALGQALHEAKQYAGAQQMFQKALETAPQSAAAPVALLGLGWAKLEADDPTAADSFVALAKDHPKSEAAAKAPEGLLAVAEKRFDQAKYAAAQTLYRQFLDLFPTSDLADEARYKLAWTLLRQNDNAGALAQFQQVAPLASDPAVAADARYQAGRLLLDKGDPQAAAQVLAPFTNQLRDAPSAAAALVLLGRAQTDLKQYEAARATFLGVTTRFAQDPAGAAAWLGLAKLQRQQGQLEAARESLNKSLASATGAVAAEAQTELGEVLRDKGDFQHAAEEFLKVAILYREPAWAARAQYQAGQCYERLQDSESAGKCYQVVLRDYGQQAPWAEQAKARLQALGK